MESRIHQKSHALTYKADLYQYANIYNPFKKEHNQEKHKEASVVEAYGYYKIGKHKHTKTRKGL